MRTLTLLFAVGGLIAGTALVAYFGFSEVAHALFAVRWTGFLTIVAFHLAVTALLGVGWYLLAPRSAPLMAFVFGRLVRDSGSEILPLSQVGGFVMGARAAALLGLPSAVAIASTIVDLTLEMLAQLGYTALGLSILSPARNSKMLDLPQSKHQALAWLRARNLQIAPARPSCPCQDNGPSRNSHHNQPNMVETVISRVSRH